MPARCWRELPRPRRQYGGLGGLDFPRAIVDECADITIIVITGFGDIPTSVRAMKAGVAEFLTKPFEKRVLLDVICAALEGNEAAVGNRNNCRSPHERYSALTSREREVIDGVVSGRTNKQVGGDSEISGNALLVRLLLESCAKRCGKAGFSFALQRAAARGSSGNVETEPNPFGHLSNWAVARGTLNQARTSKLICRTEDAEEIEGLSEVHCETEISMRAIIAVTASKLVTDIDVAPTSDLFLVEPLLRPLAKTVDLFGAGLSPAYQAAMLGAGDRTADAIIHGIEHFGPEQLDVRFCLLRDLRCQVEHRITQRREALAGHDRQRRWRVIADAEDEAGQIVAIEIIIIMVEHANVERRNLLARSKRLVANAARGKFEAFGSLFMPKEDACRRMVYFNGGPLSGTVAADRMVSEEALPMFRLFHRSR